MLTLRKGHEIFTNYRKHQLLIVDNRLKINTSVANIDIDQMKQETSALPIAIDEYNERIYQKQGINVKFFLDARLTDQQKIAILGEKLAEKSSGKATTKGYLLSFVSDSVFQLNDSSTVPKIKVLGFCYPKERLSKDELKAFFAVNLMALIYESRETSHQIPFIIPYPPSCLIGNSSNTKIFFDALQEVYEAYYPLVNKHVGKFIVQFPNAHIDQVKTKYIKKSDIELADFDLLSLAEHFAENNIQIPLPINGDFQKLPGHNQDPQASDFDTSLSRMTFNVHRNAVKNSVQRFIQNLNAKQSAQNVRTSCYRTMIRRDSPNDKSADLRPDAADLRTDDKFANLDVFNKSTDNSVSQNSVITGPSSTFYKPNTSTRLLDSNPALYDRNSADFSLKGQLNEQAHFVFFVEQAVQGLNELQDFRTNPTHAENLLKIMSFAKANNGVSRKKEELKIFFNNNDNLTNQACAFSCKFQRLMIDYGNVMDSNGKHPRSRLFRNIKLKNIEALFENSISKDEKIYKELTSSLKKVTNTRAKTHSFFGL